jgi:hypothetical protein
MITQKIELNLFEGIGTIDLRTKEFTFDEYLIDTG